MRWGLTQPARPPVPLLLLAVRARQAAAGEIQCRRRAGPSKRWAACRAGRASAPSRCQLSAAISGSQVALAERFAERWAAAGQQAAAYAMHPGWTETDGVRWAGLGWDGMGWDGPGACAPRLFAA